ncbi:hypothetical protein A33M_0765 [Rhodovulum sp. PH10]|uniref:PRC-barrel domain-containing protein n=1 Tax=Rhodovulum sp. PH10 TaxID=1187851 RepID=UPI00027C2DF1|nr:PRC-barrel domain-containing protein [Rhodovulum sp. PH10]EJW09950.1 hypothetical protein A33M_0765 [Rhodovulum sp. PH10]
MRRLSARAFLSSTTILLALGGVAMAQPAPNQPPAGQNQPPAQAAPQPAPGAAGQPGLRQVDPSANVQMTFYTVQPADLRASKLMDADVYNLNNEEIGEVEDLILDQGKVLKAVVVDVGGFLGIGNRHVAVDPRSIVVSNRNGDDDDVRLVVNTTRDDLKNAPPFDFASMSGGRAQTTGRAGQALNPNAQDGANKGAAGQNGAAK